VAPEIVERGLIRSFAAYVDEHTSQLSPYWSSALHLGHVPLMKRSARNKPFSGSNNCVMRRVAILPFFCNCP
jgi:hypothetical protein